MKPDLPERKHFGVFVGIGQFSYMLIEWRQKDLLCGIRSS